MIQLNYRDAKPIYEQIKDGLTHLLVSKAIETGEKLPSVRELAASLAINPNTIQRAYKELESEGYIYTVSGKGTFAAGQDDVVEIRKVSDASLVGSAPDITRHFIELRGIGIIDVKTLFGVESVKEKQNIDLVIKLEDWNKDKEYDRLGLEDQYTEVQKESPETWAAFLRRIHEVQVYLEDGTIVKYDSVEKYLNRNKEFHKLEPADECPFN